MKKLGERPPRFLSRTRAPVLPADDGGGTLPSGLRAGGTGRAGLIVSV